MNKTLAAVTLGLLAQGAWAQSFDGSRGAGLPAFHMRKVTITRNISPEAKLAQSAKAAVVNILVVIKWADVPDSDLPLDARKMPPDLAAELQFMGPKAAKDFAAKNPKFRASRSDLPTFETVASGSGFVVKAPNGELVLVTNHHVVNVDEIKKHVGATPEFHVKPSNDQFARSAFANDVVAKVGATGKRGMDIAFLKIPATRADGSAWDVLPLGDSSNLQEGEDVWAMGFPMGLNFTMTKGIVSAVHETMDDPYVSYVQTDAPINPGNSGGPLVRVEGSGSSQRVEVVGMDTMILSNGGGEGGEGGSIGLGFAIESNTIKRALKMYLNTGSIDVGYVGMVFGPAKGLAKNAISVQKVSAGGPAEKAGLKAGDVVESVDGQTLSDNPEVAEAQLSRGIKAKDPGETVQIVVKRGGQDMTINIVVEKEPENLQQPVQAAQDDDK